MAVLATITTSTTCRRDPLTRFTRLPNNSVDHALHFAHQDLAAIRLAHSVIQAADHVFTIADLRVGQRLRCQHLPVTCLPGASRSTSKAAILVVPRSTARPTRLLVQRSNRDNFIIPQQGSHLPLFGARGSRAGFLPAPDLRGFWRHPAGDRPAGHLPGGFKSERKSSSSGGFICSG